jgi:dihydroneopterin aldolase
VAILTDTALPHTSSLAPNASMDTIFIHEFKLDIRVGIYAWERVAPQTVQFDIEIGIPAKKAEKISDTVDYARVVARIEESLNVLHTDLLEQLAEHVAGIILGEFKAPWVRVSVAKLGALGNVKRLGVVIERGTREG